MRSGCTACLIVVIALAGGCRRAAEAPPAPPDPVPFVVPPSETGRLSRIDVGLLFVPCGDAPGAGVILADHPEASGLLDGLGDSETGVTAMLRQADSRITELRYLGLEGPDCRRLPPDGRLVARGNEPFWNARVDDERIVVTTPESMDGVTYGDVVWHQTGDGYRVEGTRAGEPPLVLDVFPDVCLDSMSGARYPYRVVLARMGTVTQGCAIEGRLATDELPLAIVDALPDDYFGEPPAWTRAFHASIDLDGDGRAERVVHLRGPLVCGTGGCPTLVFTPDGDGFRLVSTIGLTRPPLLASATWSNGWRNLIVEVSGGGLPGAARELAFDGTTYPSNPTAPLAPEADPVSEAELLIPEPTTSAGRLIVRTP